MQVDEEVGVKGYCYIVVLNHVEYLHSRLLENHTWCKTREIKMSSKRPLTFFITVALSQLLR